MLALEDTMQRVSRYVSLIGLGLMVIGFVDFLADGTNFSIPGFSVVPLPKLMNYSQFPLSVYAMSAGIVLFALLPTVRVVLALWTYVRQHSWVNTVAAFIVFIELLLSIRIGG